MSNDDFKDPYWNFVAFTTEELYEFITSFKFNPEEFKFVDVATYWEREYWGGVSVFQPMRLDDNKYLIAVGDKVVIRMSINKSRPIGKDSEIADLDILCLVSRDPAAKEFVFRQIATSYSSEVFPFISSEIDGVESFTKDLDESYGILLSTEITDPARIEDTRKMWYEFHSVNEAAEENEKSVDVVTLFGRRS